MSAVITHRLVDLSRALQTAAHGQRTALCRAAAQDLDMSLSAVYRKLENVTVAADPRKRRSDAGTSVLTRAEALTLSTALIESARKNEKRLYSLPDAVEALRASGMIKAEFIDHKTGEIRQLSTDAIARALYNYRLHPEQLMAPAPVTGMVSLHPNHVWQIDASLCVLYYLKPGADCSNGLQVMDHDKFYKNKPKNLARITANRVWSYEITDHTSGWVYVEYVMGAESGENLCSVLINAMQERDRTDMLHGVPKILMMDPGSANTSAMTKNLCSSLGIQMIVHAPGAARVTGQVENARNLIERKFEAGLRFQPVADLDELNALAKKWRAHFNATAKHRRHGKTRSALFMTIQQDQLVKAPSVAKCRELAVAAPVERRVSSKLWVSFQGSEYDVSGVPGLLVGEKVLITFNPWRADVAQLLMTDEHGHELYYVVPAVEYDKNGFALRDPVIGQGHKRQAETPAQQARKEAERLAMGVDSDEALQAARKAKAIPFGGQLQPYKHIDEATLPDFLPRRGTEHGLVAPSIEIPPMSIFAMAKRLQAEVPGWGQEHYRWLNQQYPDGTQEEALPEVLAALRAAFSKRPALALAGGA